MKFRKKDLFAHIINITFFVLTWLFINSGLFVAGRVENVEDFFKMHIVSSSLGYNNLYQIVGVTFTVLFVLSSARVLDMDNPYMLIKYNRDGFVKHKIKRMAVNTVLFVLEYIVVHIFFCIIFCKFSVLNEVRFFLCMLLFYISLFEYFIIVGMSMQFLQYLFKFKNAYMVVPIILFCALTIGQNTLGVNIAPVYFSDFISDFVESGIFDWYSYAVNTVETVIVFFILAILSRITFLKRDIIIDEKTES